MITKRDGVLCRSFTLPILCLWSVPIRVPFYLLCLFILTNDTRMTPRVAISFFSTEVSSGSPYTAADTPNHSSWLWLPLGMRCAISQFPGLKFLVPAISADQIEPLVELESELVDCSVASSAPSCHREFHQLSVCNPHFRLLVLIATWIGTWCTSRWNFSQILVAGWQIDCLGQQRITSKSVFNTLVNQIPTRKRINFTMVRYRNEWLHEIWKQRQPKSDEWGMKFVLLLVSWEIWALERVDTVEIYF